MTGYGIGFPKGSRWLPVINKHIIDYQHTGYLQQLQEFWLTGACKERNQQRSSTKSQELGILNFSSVFIMLTIGLIVGSISLLLEHIYMKYWLKSLRTIDRCGFCGFISMVRRFVMTFFVHVDKQHSSQNVGASLKFPDAVQHILNRENNCNNRFCQMKQQLLRSQLIKNKVKISELRRRQSTC